MLARLQLLAELPEVIDFPIEDHRECSSFIPDRLAAARKIDNAEPARAGGYRRRHHDSFFVGPSMNDCSKHPANDGLTRFP